VADSNAEIAGEMRRLIQQQLDAGKNRQQIVSYFRQRYGDWILLDPPKTGLHLVVWLLPLLALLGGIVTLAVLVRRWRAAADAVPAAPEEDLERVRAAMRGREDEN
jgi:cytochrome c-type biogenesis protein CcmH